jgi:hypothetical protein
MFLRLCQWGGNGYRFVSSRVGDEKIRAISRPDFTEGRRVPHCTWIRAGRSYVHFRPRPLFPSEVQSKTRRAVVRSTARNRPEMSLEGVAAPRAVPALPRPGALAGLTAVKRLGGAGLTRSRAGPCAPTSRAPRPLWP